MAKTKLAHRLKELVKKHKVLLTTCFFGLFFIAIFITSVAGSLRVFLPYLGEITGFPFAQKNYLLVFQNNHELRPTGGFISSFGKVTFQNGIPAGIQIEDVYGTIDDHEYQKPPYPMEDLLANEWYKGYTFRDGNYSANFPDSAAELIRLYHLTRPTEKIDGVVAVNFQVLQDLLDVLGPMEVEGRQLNKDNLFEEITNQVNDVDRHNLDSLAQRKSILKPLANAIIRKIIITPFKLRLISDTLTRSLITKDIQLYFADDNLQKLVKKNNWAGEWPNLDNSSATLLNNDYLAVVETNLGGMKSDRYLTREIKYHVKFPEEYFKSDAKAQAHLQINFHHFGIENIPLSGPYRGYFRIYNQVAQISSALSLKKPDPASSDNPVSGPIADSIVKLQPGEEKTIEFNYSLPHGSKDGYSLTIPKQSGTNDLYEIIIELPRGYRTASDDFESRENFAYYRGTLSKDLKLNLQFLPDQSAPRLVLQENTQLNKISLHFNEDLNQNYADDPFSYAVTDLNIKNPQKTDQIRISKIVTTSKDIDIYLTGQTNQPEERYGVTLRNLRDTHGNILSERQITVVQRLRK